VAFVLHAAGTIHAERWKYMTQFVEDVVSQLDIDQSRTRVALVHWNDSAYLAFPLDKYTTGQDLIAVVYLPISTAYRVRNVSKGLNGIAIMGNTSQSYRMRSHGVT